MDNAVKNFDSKREIDRSPKFNLAFSVAVMTTSTACVIRATATPCEK